MLDFQNIGEGECKYSILSSHQPKEIGLSTGHMFTSWISHQTILEASLFCAGLFYKSSLNRLFRLRLKENHGRLCLQCHEVASENFPEQECSTFILIKLGNVRSWEMQPLCNGNKALVGITQ